MARARDARRSPGGDAPRPPAPGSGQGQAEQRPAGERAARPAADPAADGTARLRLAAGALAVGRRVSFDLDVQQVPERLDAGIDAARVHELTVTEERALL